MLMFVFGLTRMPHYGYPLSRHSFSHDVSHTTTPKVGTDLPVDAELWRGSPWGVYSIELLRSPFSMSTRYVSGEVRHV